MRNSRISHPPGGRFLQIQEWAVQAVGKAAAAVLADLDFLDRGQEQAGCILASRSRLIADLEGFVSRDTVDKALAALVDIGWVHRHERVVMGSRNLQMSHEYSLDADAVSLFLTDARRPEKRTPEKLKPGMPTTGNQACNRDVRPDPSIDVLDLDLSAVAVVAATSSADTWLDSSTHPLTAAALVKIAESTWQAKPSSNIALDKKHCRQALHVAATLSDAVAAAVIDGISDRGGWPKDAFADLKSAADKHRHDTEYQAQQAAHAAKAVPIVSVAKDVRYAWLVGRYVDLPSGPIKIKASGILCSGKVKSLPQLLDEVNTGRLMLCDSALHMS